MRSIKMLCRKQMKRRIKKAHTSSYPNPISFEKGEVVGLGAEDTEYPGWVWTRTRDGNEGWAPLSYLEVTELKKATAKRSYCAIELNVEHGEEVEVVNELNGWAWCANEAGEYGWLPKEVLHNA